MIDGIVDVFYNSHNENKQLARLCGSGNVPPIISSGNTMLVRMPSANLEKFRHYFQATYEAGMLMDKQP